VTITFREAIKWDSINCMVWTTQCWKSLS